MNAERLGDVAVLEHPVSIHRKDVGVDTEISERVMRGMQATGGLKMVMI